MNQLDFLKENVPLQYPSFPIANLFLFMINESFLIVNILTKYFLILWDFIAFLS